MERFQKLFSSASVAWQASLSPKCGNNHGMHASICALPPLLCIPAVLSAGVVDPRAISSQPVQGLHNQATCRVCRSTDLRSMAKPSGSCDIFLSGFDARIPKVHCRLLRTQKAASYDAALSFRYWINRSKYPVALSLRISEDGDGGGVEVVADNVCHTSSRQGRSVGVVEEDNVCRISSRQDRSEAGGGDDGGDQPR